MPDELVEDVDEQEEVSVREIPFSDIMDDLQQGFMLNGYSNYRIDGNQLTTSFGKLSIGKVKELKDYRFDVVRTAILIIPEELNPTVFYNLVISNPLKGKKKPELVIIEYALENEVYTDDFDFSNYTGYIRRYSLNGEIINDIRMIAGKHATIANARTENICGYEYEWKSATICVGPDDDYCNTQYYWDAIPIDCVGTPEIDGGGLGGIGGTPMNPPSPIDRLNALIGIDQMGLIPCDVLKAKLKNLVTFKPPQSVINTLNSLPSTNSNIFPNNWNVHDIANAKGIAINLDYFNTNISQLPPGFTASSLLEHLRQNINSLTPSTNFSPHPNLTQWNNNTQKWQDGHLGAVILIGINPDNGSVILSDKSSLFWRFSTIYDPWVGGNHPVSGTREFGIRNNGNGFEFYTSGADRLTLSHHQLVNELSKVLPHLPDGIAFAKADELWNDFMKNVAEEVNRLGGVASKGSTSTHRPRWAQVKNAIENGNPLPINCN